MADVSHRIQHSEILVSGILTVDMNNTQCVAPWDRTENLTGRGARLSRSFRWRNYFGDIFTWKPGQIQNTQNHRQQMHDAVQRLPWMTYRPVLQQQQILSPIDVAVRKVQRPVTRSSHENIEIGVRMREIRQTSKHAQGC